VAIAGDGVSATLRYQRAEVERASGIKRRA
jgi:hypothetical protein